MIRAERREDRGLGQAGTRISPELYLTRGISGAIQHLAGCLSARHIVAVNTDPDAPVIAHAVTGSSFMITWICQSL